MSNNPKIKHLFEPRSVAVIGASSTPNKIGYTIVRNIVQSGYQGKVYPINPKGGEVLGLPIYKSMADIDDEIDLVTISIPSPFVFEAVKSCAGKGVKYLLLKCKACGGTGWAISRVNNF